MEKVITLEEALKRIEELENEKLISLDFINNKVQTYLNNVNELFYYYL